MAVTAAPNGDLGESSGPKTEPQDFKVEVAYKVSSQCFSACSIRF